MIWQTSPMTAWGPRLSTRMPRTLVTRPTYLMGSVRSTAARYLASPCISALGLPAGADGCHVEDLLLELVELARDAGVDLAEVGLDHAAAPVDGGVLDDR